MKKVIITIVAGLMVSLLSGAVLAEEKTEGLEVWWSSGYHNGNVNFQESEPGLWRGLLEFKNKGYFYLGFGGRYQLVNSELPKLSISADGYEARSYDVDIKQTSWIPYGNTVCNHSDLTGSGKQTSYDFNFGWQLINFKEGREKLDILLGYTSEEYSFRDINRVQQIYYYESVNYITLGHISSYTTSMHGAYLGIADYLNFANNKVRIDASIKYLPDAKGEGDVAWELSEESTRQSGKGDGYKAALGISFIPVANWSFGLKVSKISYKITGDSTTFDAITGHQLYYNDLDYIENKYVNTELKIGYVF